MIILWFSSSCTPGLVTQSPPIEDPELFESSGIYEVPEKWWTSFNDPILDSLIQRGLQENLSLSGNWEEYKAAMAVLQRERSFLFPQIDAFVGTTTEGPNPEISNGVDIQAGLLASYELDLWGRIRAGIQAESYTAEAFLQDYKSAAMTISSEIATTWYQLLTAKKQLQLIEEQIQTNQDMVTLIRARFAGGQIRAVDILRQEQLLESTRRQKIIYQTDLGILRNRLAVLLGRPPQNIEAIANGVLPDIPPLPGTGLPLELIRRRPDLQRSFNLLLAADREMAVAVRNKFPVISISADVGYRGNQIGNLFENWAYSLAGNLLTPIIYGGRLSAEVDRAKAVKNQRLYEYGQAVLLAFEEVENSLLQEINQQERLQILESQLELARKTSRQLRIEFLNGMSDYLDVLLALSQQQQLEREFLQMTQEGLELRIGLYRSLAGGFETERENSL